MRRTSLAALLAAPLLLAWVTPAFANQPVQCAYGHGCGGFCLNLFSKLHQHGPLFNYGPYYGYPPFEPYGPWNSYLQYNPWYYGDPNAGGRGRLFGGHGHGCDSCGSHARLAAFAHSLKGHSHGCSSCGGGLHANWLKGGWFKGGGCVGCSHGGLNLNVGHGQLLGKRGCSSCRADATDPAKTDAVARYTGIGNPQDSDAFYAGVPALDAAVLPAGK